MTPVTPSEHPASSGVLSRIDRHFVLYTAAAAGATLVPTGEANAAIVYSGLQNIPVFPATTNGGAYFDMEPPFTSAQGARGFGWELNPYASGTAIYSVPSGNGDHPAGAVGTMLVLAGANVANLTPGTVIDNTATFTAPGFYGGSGVPDGTTGILGVKFDPDGVAGNQEFFGWVRLTANSAGSGAVVDWAYEDTGAAIQAGAVPEPGSLALLAMGAAGLAGWRRRRTA